MISYLRLLNAALSERLLHMSHPTPPETLYDTLINLFLVVNENDRFVLARHGLSLPRFHVLQHLYAEPGISFVRLSDLMLTDRANVTRIIRGMEADELVSRQPNTHDRRSYWLHLTAKGAALYARAAAAHRADIASRFAAAFDDASQQLPSDFLAQLHMLREGLEAHLETLKQPAA